MGGRDGAVKIVQRKNIYKIDFFFNLISLLLCHICLFEIMELTYSPVDLGRQRWAFLHFKPPFYTQSVCSSFY